MVLTTIVAIPAAALLRDLRAGLRFSVILNKDLWVRVEPAFAVERAEVVRVAVVLALEFGGLGIHFHSTDQVDCFFHIN